MDETSGLIVDGESTLDWVGYILLSLVALLAGQSN